MAGFFDSTGNVYAGGGGGAPAGGGANFFDSTGNVGGASPGPVYGGAPPIKTGDSGIDSILASRPGYKGITDSSGKLFDPFKMKAPGSQQPWLDKAVGGVNASGVTANMGAANANLGHLEQMAHDPGLSPYAQAQMHQLDLNKGQNLGAASGAAQGATANAMDNVEMRGGLSGGAAERMQSQGDINRINAMSNVYAQDASQRAGVGANDAAFKQNLMTQLPGMDMSVAGGQNAIGMGQVNDVLGQKNLEGGQDMGVQQYNIGNATNSVMGQNPYDQAGWTTGAQVWGGKQTADAMTAMANKPAPGMLGGGGVLGTGISSPGDQYQKFGIGGMVGAGGWNGSMGGGYSPYSPGPGGMTM